MYTNPQGENYYGVEYACHKSLFNKNYPPISLYVFWDQRVDKIGDNRPSIAAVCVSLDSKATRYGRFILLRKILFYCDRRFLNSLDEGLWRLRHRS
ncbi:unnamed protein product [Rhizophagus irregularis]|nr:unnamed protein product [Rhizophagus irregularis]